MTRSDSPPPSAGAVSADQSAETTTDQTDHEVTDSEPRWPWIAGTILSALGLAVSAYLTYEHYTGSTTLACPTASHGSLINCAKVTTSPWSVEFGLPVAVVGLAYFAVMVCLQSPPAWACQWRTLRAARISACGAGLVNVIILLYDELVKIDAICEWCTSVHILTFLLFVTTTFGTASTVPARDDWTPHTFHPPQVS